MGKNDLVWIGCLIGISAKKCGILEVKRRFALGKLQTTLRLRNPSLDKVQSAGGSPRWISQNVPTVRGPLAGLYAFSKTKIPPEHRENSAEY